MNLSVVVDFNGKSWGPEGSDEWVRSRGMTRATSTSEWMHACRVTNDGFPVTFVVLRHGSDPAEHIMGDRHEQGHAEDVRQAAYREWVCPTKVALGSLL